MASVLIIGASRGIGLELTRQYMASDWDVHATTRTGAVPPSLADLPNAPTMHALDVRNMAQINALVESLAYAPIDVLIVAAGIFDRVGGQGGSGPAIPREDVFAVNATAPMNIAEAVFPNVMSSPKGRMIFLSSMAGSRRRGMRNSVYGQSKQALNDAVRQYAPEWASHGVVGLALHPGWVMTDMGGAGGQVTVEDCVTGIRWIVDEMGPEHNGGFYDYKGETVPW